MTNPHRISTLNMPFGVSYLVNSMLADDRCTPDHVLIVADHMEQMAKDLPESSHYIPMLRTSVDQLREWAPLYDKPRGKPLGDFDGTLTP